MPYPPRLVRCNINSTTPGEIVTNTVWVQRDGASVLAGVGLQEIADRVRNSWQTMLAAGFGVGGGMQSTFSSGTVFRSVTAYAVDGAGKSVAQAEANFGALDVGSSGNGCPPQVAAVVTLLTGLPGRSQRGRIYLGGLGLAGILVDGRMAPVVRDRIARNVGGFYRAIRDDVVDPDDFRPVVVSPLKTQALKITGVQVGDLYDTMRSRRNRLVENRTTVVVDP